MWVWIIGALIGIPAGFVYADAMFNYIFGDYYYDV